MSIRLIDANDLKMRIQSGVDLIFDRATESEFIYMIDSQPAIEAEPVRHGRWIPHGDDMWLCSNCKENIIFSMHESDRTEKQRYCCRCGARMDQEVQE